MATGATFYSQSSIGGCIKKVGVPKETKPAERLVAATPAGVKALTDQELTEKLLDKKVVGIAYETVQLEDGILPLLAPMSEVAGALSIHVGAYWLEGKNGGMRINTCLNTSVANGSYSYSFPY